MILDENLIQKVLLVYTKKIYLFKKLISNNNFPSSLLLSGNKGIENLH